MKIRQRLTRALLQKQRLIQWASISIWFSSVVSGYSQDGPYSGLYSITAGRYIECCGIAGGVAQSLPNQSQNFVRLTIGPSNSSGSLTFLGADKQTPFSTAPCPSTGPLMFSFSNAMFSSNKVVFSSFDPFGGFGSYTARWSQTSLTLDGAINRNAPFCNDVPTQFRHTNVVAELLPSEPVRLSATARIGEMEICWNCISNRSHQVQYRAAFDTNAWANLGSPIPGNGLTNCIIDNVPDQTTRFYRVLMLP